MSTTPVGTRLGLPIAALVVAVFLIYSWPPYLRGDSRIPLDGLPGWYHPLLVGHFALGTIAMIAGLVQLGRRWFARIHRVSGRIYVACMLGVAVMAAAIGAVTPFGPVAATSHLLFAFTMAVCTVLGVVAIRGGNVATHRRWMLRSAALTYSIVLNRVIAPAVGAVLALHPEWLHGDEAAAALLIGPITSWLSWVLALLAVEVYLELRPAPHGARADQRSADGSGVGSTKNQCSTSRPSTTRTMSIPRDSAMPEPGAPRSR